jgi:hypothetical protein
MSYDKLDEEKTKEQVETKETEASVSRVDTSIEITDKNILEESKKLSMEEAIAYTEVTQLMYGIQTSLLDKTSTIPIPTVNNSMSFKQTEKMIDRLKDFNGILSEEDQKSFIEQFESKAALLPSNFSKYLRAKLDNVINESNKFTDEVKNMRAEYVKAFNDINEEMEGLKKDKSHSAAKLRLAKLVELSNKLGNRKMAIFYQNMIEQFSQAVDLKFLREYVEKLPEKKVKSIMNNINDRFEKYDKKFYIMLKDNSKFTFEEPTDLYACMEKDKDFDSKMIETFLYVFYKYIIVNGGQNFLYTNPMLVNMIVKNIKNFTTVYEEDSEDFIEQSTFKKSVRYVLSPLYSTING